MIDCVIGPLPFQFQTFHFKIMKNESKIIIFNKIIIEKNIFKVKFF